MNKWINERENGWIKEQINKKNKYIDQRVNEQRNKKTEKWIKWINKKNKCKKTR